MINAEEIFEDVQQQLSGEPFVKITISGPIRKQAEFTRIIVAPVREGNRIYYQFSLFYEDKVKQANVFDALELEAMLKKFLEMGYKQWDMAFPGKTVKLLVNKKGNHKVTVHAHDNVNVPLSGHNNEKRYLLKEGAPIPWLVGLGIMNREGKVLSDKQKKFRQINRFLEMIDDVAHLLPEKPVIVDFGCGKSYLTFAVYFFLRQKGKEPDMIGLDLKRDVVAHCGDLAERLGCSSLRFQTGDIKDFDIAPLGRVDMVITLHACDTATDYAIFNAVRWGTDIVMSVPCCQHELFEQVENEAMRPLLKHGLLKERFSALLTDALRAGLLEVCGYKCQVMEFIDMEHTQKNVMIRAIKKKEEKSRDEEAQRRFHELRDMFHVSPVLGHLLEDWLNG